MPLAWTRRTELFHPRRLAEAVLDVLLPPTCAVCTAEVEAPGLLCPECFSGLILIAGPCCACCGMPFSLPDEATEGGLCDICIQVPPPFGRARAALRYDGASRRLILPFKHADRTELVRPLAGLMAQAGGELLRDADVLVPVPLHRRRLFLRKYNQSALLARALGQRAGRPWLLDALLRAKATQSLGGKSAAERRDEVAGVFSVRPSRADALAGRRVLLIDDVMTSGATAASCAQTLLEAGATSVDVLVAVRVPDPRMERGPRKRRWRRKR